MKGAPGDDTLGSLGPILREVAHAPCLAPPPDFAPGLVVDGAFRIERRLGAGGMGVVYLAHDVRLGRDVALKVHTGGVDEATRARALGEAKVMARLTHPNVVAVHEVGTHEGRLFIAMEYVDGGTLRDWLAERPRRPAEIVDRFLEAGRGLAAAHAAGLVHRDFKPDNVLLGQSRARVADFGLALEPGRPQTSVLSQSKNGDEHEHDNAVPVENAPEPPLTAAGTPGYMSPEQGTQGPADARRTPRGTRPWTDGSRRHRRRVAGVGLDAAEVGPRRLRTPRGGSRGAAARRPPSPAGPGSASRASAPRRRQARNPPRSASLLRPAAPSGPPRPGRDGAEILVTRFLRYSAR